MMKQLTLLNTVLLVGLILSGCTYKTSYKPSSQPNIQAGTQQLDENRQALDMAQHSASDFPEEVINGMIADSFATMSKEYTEYASYFNVCQKKPDEPVCGAPYQTAMTRYKQAKANHEVLDMLWTSDLKNMVLPPVAESGLADSLITLGYLDYSKKESLSSTQIKQATYLWMQDNGLAKTESILLLHQVLLKSAALTLEFKG